MFNINDYYLGVVKMANTKTQKELKISNVNHYLDRRSN